MSILAPPPPATSRATSLTKGTFEQGTFEQLATPLRDVTFVVVDLETTGGSAADCAITEIGAVKVRGGERLGEFQTLVNPGVAIPPFIAVLTGITNAAVAGAPRIGEVLPSFLDWARGAVLVAHNAPFDVGFLRASCAREGLAWPSPAVVDTVRLARGAFTRDEAPNCKLATLARVVRSPTTPDHRALSDARATVDVLHAALERLAGLGVSDLDELLAFSTRVSPQQRGKRHLAEHVPAKPGVYSFRDGSGRVLYVGKSKNLRSRVRSYFTAAETRRRMVEMVAIAEAVTVIECPTALEAEVRELRLIAEHKPPYNRRSRFPEKSTWLKLTDEAFPRLSLVRTVKPDESFVGPFGSRRAAEDALAAVHEVFPLRQCTAKLSARKRITACILAALGRCGAPCDGRQSQGDYAGIADAVRAALRGQADELVPRTTEHLTRLARDERYEDAARSRDRLVSFLRGAARRQRAEPVLRLAEISAARRTLNSSGFPDGGWEIVVVRHGRLAGTAVAKPGVHPLAVLDSLRATAESVSPAQVGFAALPEETDCVLRWLREPGVRLIELDGVWCSPTWAADRHLRELEQIQGRRTELPSPQPEPPATEPLTSRPQQGDS